MNNLTKYGLLALRVLVALAFLAAGLAKLAGVEMMVATFDAVGFGQWFRNATGLIEIGAALLLFVPGLQVWGAGLLVITMTGAVFAHLTVIGPTLVPAATLGVLSALILYTYRGQLTAR